MAYIGIQPAEKFTSFATQEFSTSATTSYTLDHAVANENEIALFVNNVRQQPGSGKAYTATGTALTLSAATASTDTMYCVFLGRALQTVTPATNSITAAMVGNDLISGKDALTSAPASTDELLISDAGVLKRIDFSLIGGTNTPNFHAYRSGNLSIANATFQAVVFNTEYFDSDSAYNVSDGKFTVPSGEAGKYLFTFQTRRGNWHSNRLITALSINGSERLYAEDCGDADKHFGSAGASVIFDLSVGDYVQIICYHNNGSAQNITGVSNQSSNFFTGMKLI